MKKKSVKLKKQNAKRKGRVKLLTKPPSVIEIDFPPLIDPIDEKLDQAKWGDLRGKELQTAVDDAYLEVVRWRRNLFMLPTGKAGEDFIEEITSLFNHFNNASPFEPIAFTLMAIIMPLLLQKPSKNSKCRDHVSFLEKRLKLWKTGRLQELLEEGRSIQERFTKDKGDGDNGQSIQKDHKRFISLMEKGKIGRALRCIGSQRTGVLDVTEDVMNELIEKHPEAQDIKEGVYQGPLKRKPVEEALFQSLDSDAIHKATKKVDGAAGPSGADSELWQRLVCSKQFKKKPAGLCIAIAETARKLTPRR